MDYPEIFVKEYNHPVHTTLLNKSGKKHNWSIMDSKNFKDLKDEVFYKFPGVPDEDVRVVVELDRICIEAWRNI